MLFYYLAFLAPTFSFKSEEAVKTSSRILIAVRRSVKVSNWQLITLEASSNYVSRVRGQILYKSSMSTDSSKNSFLRTWGVTRRLTYFSGYSDALNPTIFVRTRITRLLSSVSFWGSASACLSKVFWSVCSLRWRFCCDKDSSLARSRV